MRPIKHKSLFARMAITALVAAMVPLAASAGQLTSRNLTLSSSAASNTNTTYTFNVTVPASDTSVIKSVGITFCTTASGACTLPTGMTTTGATLTQPTGLGSASGWTGVFTTNGTLQFTNGTNATAPSGSQVFAFGGITNPSTTNTTFFARITTYSDASYTTAVSTGTVAASTANTITVTATVNESLTFCVYTGANCASSGSTVALGTLSSASTSTGTSKMDAGTNAVGGYVITVNGTSLTSGANPVIPAYSSAAAPAGTAGFGINLMANTTPSVGANATTAAAPSLGAAAAGYGTTNQFSFATGATVAQTNPSGGSAASNTQTYTVSYVANIGAATPASAYSTTLTYICTATF